MNEGGGLKSLARFLIGYFSRREVTDNVKIGKSGSPLNASDPYMLCFLSTICR